MIVCRPRILLKKLLVCLCVISFSSIVEFKLCRGMERLAFIDYAIRGGSVLATIGVLFFIIFSLLSKRYKISPTCLLIIMMYGFFILNSLFRGYSLAKRGTLANFVMALLFDYILYRKDSDSFRAMLNTLNVLAFINCITIIIYYPQRGMPFYANSYQSDWHYFLGYDNGHIITLFPIICFNSMIYMRTRQKIYLVPIIISLIGVIITTSATTILMLAMILCIYYVHKYSPFIRKIILNRWVIVFSLLLAFLFFFLMNGFTAVSDVLMRLFGKDIATSGRARLFPIALSYIRKSWLIGYGYSVSDSWIGGYNSPHNVFFNFLLTGGIVGLIWYLSIILMVLREGRKSIYEHREFRILFSGIIAYVAASFAEGYDTYVTFYLFWCVCLALKNWKSMNVILEQYNRRRMTLIRERR